MLDVPGDTGCSHVPMAGMPADVVQVLLDAAN